MDKSYKINCVQPIKGRHVPHRMENGNLIIEDDLVLVIDQLDKSFAACKTTFDNLILLGIIPMSVNLENSSTLLTAFNSESQAMSSQVTDSEITDSQIIDSHVLDSSKESQAMDSQVTDSEVTDSQVMDSSKISKIGTKWSTDATLFLINQWQKNSSQFASTTIKNAEVWKNIAKELEDAGFMKYTWKQVEDKWKNLRKGYMKVKDNKGDKSSGAPRVTCKFFEELDEIFRKSPSVKPISIASSSRKCNRLSVADSDSDSDKENLSKWPKKKVSKIQKDTVELLSILRDDANTRVTARENRHQETLTVLNRAIDSYEAQMQKLLDKM